jgi:ankyrin repeat protein
LFFFPAFSPFNLISVLFFQNNSVLKRDKSNKNTLHYCTGQRSALPAAIIAMTAPHLMEQADEDGFKPIHLAVIQGSLETVNLLLANKVDVNALDNEGHSVVHWSTGKLSFAFFIELFISGDEDAPKIYRLDS